MFYFIRKGKICEDKLLYFVHAQSLSWLFAAPSTVAQEAPLSMGFSSKNVGVGWHFLLQGIFPTQGFNPGLLHCRQILYPWVTWEAPNSFILMFF